MKYFKILLAASAATLAAALLSAADAPKKDHPPGKQAGCCAKAEKEGHTCTHACCVEAAKNHKNCEKCKGTNEPKA